jgi:uncharacterized MnhB-related membrane protein
MTALVALVLGLVAAGGTAVVLTRDPFRQAVVVGVYGMVLAVLFLVLQAPDVALSIGAVSVVALPLMLLLTLTKIRERRP